MKKSFLIIGLLLISFPLYAQTIFFKSFYGAFGMEDVKALQEQLLNDITIIGIDAKIVESFPAQFNYQGGGTIALGVNTKLALFLEYASTGGRIHYADYSGEISLDQIATAFSIGSALYFNISKRDLEFFISGRMMFSTLKNKSLVRVEISTINKLEFTSTSLGIEPGIKYNYTVGRFIFNASVSYLINLRSTLEFSDVDDAYLQLYNGKQVSMNWGGYRAGLGIEFLLH